MADHRSPLLRHQANLLRKVADLALCTDESVAARLAELGHPCDRTTLVSYRMGRRTAPLGLLSVILGHVDSPREVLDVIARDYGLQVIDLPDIDAQEQDLTSAAMDVMAEVGALMHQVREAVADGRLDPEERAGLLDAVDTSTRELAELRSMLVSSRGVR